MPTVMVGSALGIFAYVAGNAVFAKYLVFPYIPGAGELTVFCGAIAGAGLGFLWFNAYPAEVFMGDVGALALGAALGTIAVIVRQEIVLFIMGGVFVVETLSVMLQVAYFKLTGGKRIFRMAPLHHHYELKGWKENAGRGALLDHHHDAGAVRAVDAEAALMSCATRKPQDAQTQTVLVLGLGDTGPLAGALVCGARAATRARRRHARGAAGARRAARRAAARRGLAHRAVHAGAARRASTCVAASARACRCAGTGRCSRGASRAGIPVIGDIELFARASPRRRQRARHCAARRGRCSRSPAPTARARSPR